MTREPRGPRDLRWRPTVVLLLALLLFIATLLTFGEPLAERSLALAQERGGAARRSPAAANDENDAAQTSSAHLQSVEFRGTARLADRPGVLRPSEAELLRQLTPLALRDGFEQALAQLLAEPWRMRYAEALAPLREQRARYIQGYASPSLSGGDGQTPQLSLTVRVDLVRVAGALRRLGLPVRGDPLRGLVMSHAAAFPFDLRSKGGEALRKRLQLLNLRTVDLRALDASTAARFASPALKHLVARRRWLQTLPQKPAAPLLLHLDAQYLDARHRDAQYLDAQYPDEQRRPSSDASSGASSGVLEALFYLRHSGDLLARIEVPLPKKASPGAASPKPSSALSRGVSSKVEPPKVKLSKGALSEVLLRLSTLLTPESLGSEQFFVSGERQRLAIAVRGLQQVSDQEALGRLLFVGRPVLAELPSLARFRLQGWAVEQQVYVGQHRLAPQVIARQLDRRRLGAYRLQLLDVTGQRLTLRAESLSAAKRSGTASGVGYPPLRAVQPLLEVRIALQARQWIEEAFATAPAETPRPGEPKRDTRKRLSAAAVGLHRPRQAEREPNHWFPEANAMSPGQVVYGRLASRTDRDFFGIRFPARSGQKSGQASGRLVWYRLGRAELNPTLRIYRGSDRRLIATHRAGRRSFLRLRLPAGFYWVEVADRYREADPRQGGLREAHYLLGAATLR